MLANMHSDGACLSI